MHAYVPLYSSLYNYVAIWFIHSELSYSVLKCSVHECSVLRYQPMHVCMYSCMRISVYADMRESECLMCKDRWGGGKLLEYPIT